MTDRHTDRKMSFLAEMNERTERKTGRQTDREVFLNDRYRWTGRHTGRQTMGRLSKEQKGRQTYGKAGGRQQGRSLAGRNTNK